jgi:hypothetical protein
VFESIKNIMENGIITDYNIDIKFMIWNAHKSNAHLILWGNIENILITGSLVGGCKIWKEENRKY